MASPANNSGNNQELVLPPGAGQVVLYTPPANGSSWAPNTAIELRAGQPIIRVALGGQQLRVFCHNNMQLAVLALPGRDVLVVRGAITLAQVMSHRPSYINALLIQSRGAVALPPCRPCADRAAAAADGFSRPFPTCVRLAGSFGGCCANCKWRDHGARCPFSGLDDSDDEDAPPPRPRGRNLLAGSSAANPITL